MSEDCPKVSFGLPVRNGGESIRKCLDSLLAQDLADIEVVVSDNASTDGTQDVIREYAARDPRVRPFLNETDVGQIENFNGVVRLARGEYFRWIGAEDWLEPEYARQCGAALDEDPDLIAVTTFFRIHIGEGQTRYREYEGELMESARPERRFQRMLWTFFAGDTTYEPLYSLIRRDVLLATGLVQMMVKADRILAAQLALAGRFSQLPECLAHRWKPRGETVHSEKYLKRYRPERSDELQSDPWRQFRALMSVVWSARISTVQKLRCIVPALGYYAKASRIHQGTRLRKLRRSLGLTRRNLKLGGSGPRDRT